MFRNKTILIVLLSFAITSCADTLDSVKRGLTGQKGKTTDEFLVKKKDPLILPPDFENLPTPADREIAVQSAKEISDFEKKLKKDSSAETDTSSPSSAERSILQKIKKN